MERNIADLTAAIDNLAGKKRGREAEPGRRLDVSTQMDPTPEKRMLAAAEAAQKRAKSGKAKENSPPRRMERLVDGQSTTASSEGHIEIGGPSKYRSEKPDHPARSKPSGRQGDRVSAFLRLEASEVASSKGARLKRHELEAKLMQTLEELDRVKMLSARKERRSPSPRDERSERRLGRQERQNPHLERSEGRIIRKSVRSLSPTYATADSPLTQHVLEFALPKNFNMPQIDCFDGKQDPGDHIMNFKAKMCLLNAPDEILCRAFPTTLKGPASTWYSHLEAGSIYNFSKLSRQFLNNFAGTRKPKKPPTYLFTVRQSPEESLRKYLSRFNSELLDIDDKDDQIAIAAFIAGLDRGPLLLSFWKHSPRSMSELLQRAQVQIMADDHMKCRDDTDRRERGSPRRREKKRDRTPERGRQDRRRDAKDNQRKTEYTQKYKNYTPLSASIPRIFSVIMNDKETPWPAPIKKGRGTQFCDFHRSKGHDTADCLNLRDEIERRIQKGDLAQFRADFSGKEAYDLRERLPRNQARQGGSSKSRGQSRGRSRERSRTPRQERGPLMERNTCSGGDREKGRDVINSIFGGFASGGTSNSQRKEHARKIARLSRTVNSVAADGPQQKRESITFSDMDLVGIGVPHDDALVLELVVANKNVKRVLVDGGSSVDIIWEDCFDQMGIGKSSLREHAEPVFGFSGEKVYPLGSISLEVTVGVEPRSASVMAEFLVMKGKSSFNMILGRPILHALRAVHSTFHQVLKFPTKSGVGEVKGVQFVARQCYNNSFRCKYQTTCKVVETDPRGEEATGVGPGEEVLQIALSDEEPEKTVLVSSTVPPSEKQGIISLLRGYADVFAWSHKDMPGIPRSIIQHELSVVSTSKPYRQKRRMMSPEKNLAVHEEVARLLAAGFIREVQYPEWLANVVLVKKTNGKWRMCVDFTNLNKACPKDSFPLPKIDALVDSTAGHEALSFLDAYSGYNQVKLKKEDEEKTSFITDRGTYCYTVMPFGVKNGCATFQRLVNRVFDDLIGHTMEVYIDDMLVKSKRRGDHVAHLEECLKRVRANSMRLNPEKCVFGVSAGKFLGFLVSNRGIEANPSKIQALVNIPSPQTIRQVQALTGRVAALNRFVSRATDKCLPFFKVIKQAGRCSSKLAQKICWDNECEEALQQLKGYMGSPPLLSSPEPGETLFLYLAVSAAAVSSVLIREDDGVQLPVYYTSRSLKGAEGRYPKLEKLAFALVTAARRLRPYFQAHSISVYTNQPLKAVLYKPETSGRLIKWCVELGEFDIRYLPRTAIKGQALADFLVELEEEGEELCQDLITTTDMDTDEASPPKQSETPPPGELHNPLPVWIIFVDGSSTTTRSGAGIVLISPEGMIFKHSLAFNFKATNNEAEYEAVLAGLKLARAVGADNIELRSDSQLVVNQISGEYEAREENMAAYLLKTKLELSFFKTSKVVQIPREENFAADALARLASTAESEVYVELLEKPSVVTTGGQVLQVTEERQEPSWMDPIIAFLRDGTLPEAKEEARKLKRRSASYYLSEIYPGVLFKRGFSLPDLRCVDSEQAESILAEIHQGDCGNHSGGRTLALKALRQGYHWPTMVYDSKEFVQKCDACQKFAFNLKQRPEPMTPVMVPWPFAQWGIDITGPFPPASGQVKFLIVAVDYFTKWVEAKAVPTITSQRIEDFVWSNIVCRFGVPKAIVSDNGKQFDCAKFREFCASKGIRNYFSSPYHPQANGQVEAMNKTLVQSLKKKLAVKSSKDKGDWPKFIPEVLWAHRTTPMEATGETPFSLAFGTEAVIPAEVNHLSVRTLTFNPEENEAALRVQLDFLDEKRDAANLRNAVYKQRISRYYNSKVRLRSFKEGDLVLKRVNQSTKERGTGKLGPSWEGPYLVVRVGQKGAYELQDRWGKLEKHPWNAEHLKKYYQ